MSNSIGLTPTQDLMMEVLVARKRLGHGPWSLSRNRAATRAAKVLEAKGLISLMHGMTEFSFRAEITDEGMKLYSQPGYVAPILGGAK